MDFFYNYIFLNIIPFSILICLVTFVHEWGHFIVARKCGVKVEVFSIGFGKKLWVWRWGDTHYCLSLLPLGGYVKMFGVQPQEDVPENQKKYAFKHKTVLQRMAIILAGPLINLIFAVLLFAFIALWGEPYAQPVVGDVKVHSHPYKLGFRSGDEIISIDGKAISHWGEFESSLEDKAHKKIIIEVKRKEKILSLFVPIDSKKAHITRPEKDIGSIKDLSPFSLDSVVAVKNKPFDKTGFLNFDKILSINEVNVKYFRELNSLLKTLKPPLTFKVRNQEKSSQERTVISHKSQTLESLGLESTELYIWNTKDKAPAQKAGIIKGDRLVKINGKRLKSWQQVSELISNYKKDDSALQIEILRKGEHKTLSMKPEILAYTNQRGVDTEKPMIGIAPALFMAGPGLKTIASKNLFTALKRGVLKSYNFSVSFFIGLWRIIEAQISTDKIGSVITIGKLAKDHFKMGFIHFINITGILSVYLFIINLLPIPLLDGGHFLFCFIELIKGSPLNYKKIEWAHITGFVVLVSLMLFALFNDIRNFFTGW